MTSKYELGDRVLVKTKYYLSNVEGVIQSITVTPEKGLEYSLKLYYPNGITLQGEDVSGQEMIGTVWVKEETIRGKVIMSMEQANEREQMIFHEDYDERNYHGGIRSFEKLDLATAASLLQKGYLSVDEQQNNSPTVGEILEFCTTHELAKGWALHGYTVSRDRADIRVSIEGIDGVGPFSVDTIIAFSQLFHDADEFYIDRISAHCWYD